ncbi:MAG: hypothetical protein U0S48_13265 [Solirubrobacteraceae bacterium]
MRTHFISRLALLTIGAFGVVVSQVWTGGTLQWLFFAGGIAMMLIAAADAVRPSMVQRGLDGMIILLGAWTVVESLVLNGADLKWWSFGIACAAYGLGVIGITVHELTTERVVHELDVKTGQGTREPHPLPTA